MPPFFLIWTCDMIGKIIANFFSSSVLIPLPRRHAQDFELEDWYRLVTLAKTILEQPRNKSDQVTEPSIPNSWSNMI